MKIESSQIPHIYRNRFLRDGAASSAVNISQSGSGSTTTTNTFNPVYIWGQYFDDTEDINGDFTTNGSITADGSLSVNGDSSLHYVCTENIEPRATNLYSLGSLTKKWKNLFATDASIDNLNSQNINTHNLTVTGSAHFFELIIDKLKSVGGTVILSAANAKIDKVVSVSGGYKLYWRKEDADRAKAISNDFAVNDQVICQSFNAQTGISHNVSNKYYWRLVTATGEESTLIDGESLDCNYIVVSNTIKDGDSVPEIGDEVMQLGYRGTDDAERQSAIILSAYKSPDTTVKAPSIAQYTGINDSNLSTHKYTWFAANGNNIRGNLKVSSGTSVEDLITEFAVDEDAIIARINSSLGPTGIDIVNQLITLTAANTSINGNLNLYDDNNAGLTVYDGDNIPRVNIQSDAIDSISTIANDTYAYYTDSANTYNVSNYQFTTPQEDVTISQYGVLDLDKFTVYIYSTDGTTNYFPGSGATVTLTANFYSPGGTLKATKAVTCHRADAYGRFTNTTARIRFFADSYGVYKINYTAKVNSATASGTQVAGSVNSRWQKATNSQTYIGKDGFYTHSGAHKLIWADEWELQFRYGFNGIRWNDADKFKNSAMQVVAGTRGTSPNIKPVWFPFYNFIPMFDVGVGTTPYLFTLQLIGNINETKYAFRIDAQRDSGICYVRGQAQDSDFNYQDSWVILPPETFTDSESANTVALPEGYTITIINDSGGPLYVVPYSTTEHDVKIVDSNQNDNYYCSLNGTQTNDTYTYIGSYSGGRHWRAWHDTQ